MKNPKTFLFLSILVAVLILGIAYAALSQDLTIDSQATVAPDGSNFQVAFDGATVIKVVTAGEEDSTAETKARITTSAAGVTTASLVVPAGVLKTVNDYVEVEYTVKNSSKDLIATLTDLTVTPTQNDGYVTFTAQYKTPVDKELGVTVADNTTVVVVRATLIKAPNEQTITAKADVTFEASASEVE